MFLRSTPVFVFLFLLPFSDETLTFCYLVLFNSTFLLAAVDDSFLIIILCLAAQCPKGQTQRRLVENQDLQRLG